MNKPHADRTWVEDLGRDVSDSIRDIERIYGDGAIAFLEDQIAVAEKAYRFVVADTYRYVLAELKKKRAKPN